MRLLARVKDTADAGQTGVLSSPILLGMPAERRAPGEVSAVDPPTTAAVAAAATAARRLGILVGEPVVLHCSNNMVVWLRPSPVVAKVGVGHYDRLAEEIEIGAYLALHGAPVVGPAAEIPPRVYVEDGHKLTFWQHRPQSGRTPSYRAIAVTLHALHRVLDTLPGSGRPPLRRIEEGLLLAKRTLAELEGTLAHADRAVLGEWLDRGIHDFADPDHPAYVLHGSPHDGNVLSTESKPLFIDFETVATGPLEWDLAHLDERAAHVYPGTCDEQRLALCRTIVSAQVAVWCWAGSGRSPDLLWHARHHLAAVNRAHGYPR